MTFEEKNKRLNEIISLLQNKETTLTDSLALYKEGVKLSKDCLKELKTAKGKLVEIQEIIDEIESKNVIDEI